MAEVIIVGAGLAGLNAARTLLEHGIDVEIFEASERVGGRARTVRVPGVALPIELGPEFVHGDPAETRALVRDPSIEILETAEGHHILQGNELHARDNIWERFGELLSRAKLRSDKSAHDYILRVKMTGLDAELFASYVEGFYGADLRKISIASVAEDSAGAAGNGPPSAYFLPRGYGSVVDFIAAQIPADRIHLGCAVERVDWKGHKIRVGYAQHGKFQTETAPRVIIAVPLGVLQAKMIEIVPKAHAEAIEDLAMGHVTKLVVQLREPIWEAHDANRLDFIHCARSGFPTYWLRSRRDTHLLTAWAGGKHARALHAVSVDTLLELALDGFATATQIDRGRLGAAVVDRFHHDYSSDPLTRGAYSYVSTRGGDAIERLSQPVEDRLLFAGEATDVDYEGTVAGALRSGKRAAEQILRIAAHKLAG